MHRRTVKAACPVAGQDQLGRAQPHARLLATVKWQDTRQLVKRYGTGPEL